MSPARSCKRLFLSIALVAMATHPLRAQESLRDLTGQITDRRHEPLRGAVVQVENERTHSVISYITGRSGQYSFKRLGGDTNYSVSVTYRGAHSKTKELNRFDIKKNPVIDFIIELH